MKVSKSAIFLFELMVVILVFSIAAAICTSIFAKGFQFSAQSENLTRAVIKAESAAEVFKNNPSSASESEVFFDKNWEPMTTNIEAAFTIKLQPSSDGKLYSCIIDVINNHDDKSIYSIEVAKFQP